MLFQKNENLLRMQFQIEFNYLYILCVHNISRILIDSLAKVDSVKYGGPLEALKIREMELNQLTQGIDASSDIFHLPATIPNKILPNDYPMETLEMMLKESETLWEHYRSHGAFALGEKLSSYQATMQNALYILRKYIILIDFPAKSSLLGKLSPQYKYLETAKICWKSLNSAKMYVDEQIISGLGHPLHAEVKEHIGYKMLYCYFTQMLCLPAAASSRERSDEAMEDAYDHFIRDLSSNLHQVAMDDLWLLGNHNLSDFLERSEIRIPLQQLTATDNHLMASVQRRKLMELVENPPTERFAEYIFSMISQHSLIDKLHEHLFSRRSLYRKLEQSLIELIELYEQYELSPLTQSGYLDEREAFELFVRGLGFEQDSLKPGDMLELDRCITITDEPTDDPEKDFTIKALHQRGIVNGERIIKKNVVTVYRLQIEEETGHE